MFNSNTLDYKQVFSHLKSCVFNDKILVTIHDISKTFQIHISEAVKILEDFVDENKNLFIKYLITWNEAGSADSIALRRFLIVSGIDELNYYKSSQDGITYHVYSVSKEKIDSNLVFNKFIFNPHVENLEKIQRTSYICNDQVYLRPIRRKCLLKSSDYDKLNHDHGSQDFKVSKSPRKRDNGRDETSSPEHKRIKTVDENSPIEDNFVTTQVKIPDSPEDSQETKEKIETHKETNKKKVLKVKTQTQTSIMNFFKKA